MSVMYRRDARTVESFLPRRLDSQTSDVTYLIHSGSSRVPVALSMSTTPVLVETAALSPLDISSTDMLPRVPARA